jgi:hypothetical protein
MLAANLGNHAGGKSLVFSAAAAFLVQGQGNLVVGLLLCELSHFVDEGFRVTPAVSRFQWQLDHAVFGGPSLPAQMQDRLMLCGSLFRCNILERVMHDGTKIKACAGADSFRREERVAAHLEAARQQVQAMGDPRADESARQRAARQRAVRERQRGLEQALEQLGKIREVKSGTPAQESARVSLTDPEARIMKQSDGGYAPSYNVQLSTEASHKIIVGAGVSQSASDYGELIPAVERVEENLGHKPQQMVTDGDFTSRQNVLEMEAKGVDLIGSMGEGQAQSAGQMKRRGVAEEFYPEAFVYDAAQDSYRCPAGQTLRHTGQEQRPGVVQHQYRAEEKVCAACPFKAQCCPQNTSNGRSITRAVEAPQVQAFAQKMQTEGAKRIYRQRGAIAEFPNAWIKEKLGLRQFRLRGVAKVLLEVLWAALTYNIQQWIRLRWRPGLAATTS